MPTHTTITSKHLHGVTYMCPLNLAHSILTPSIFAIKNFPEYTNTHLASHQSLAAS